MLPAGWESAPSAASWGGPGSQVWEGGQRADLAGKQAVVEECALPDAS